MIKGQRALLTDKNSGNEEFGTYYGRSSDNYIIEIETGSVKLYPMDNWKCEEERE